MDSENSGPSSSSGIKVFTRKYLFDRMQRQNLSTFDEKLEFLENYLLVRYGDTDVKLKCLKHKFSHLKSEMKRRWLNENKTESKFLSNNETRLEGTFEIPIGMSSHSGRPSKSFTDSSERSKRRKTEELRESAQPEAIVHAAQMILQSDGKRSASRILKDISNSPATAVEYRKRLSGGDKAIPPLTPFDALKMVVEADLTRRQYEIIRATNKSHFPCYDLVLKAKQECYPPKTASIYRWHPMTPTMHKILIHGASIIESALLPIGQLSEEAAEARNKHFRLYRQNFARKFSREECNLDIFLRLLTSDPLISCTRTIKKAPRKSFLKETTDLLLPAELNVETEHNPDAEAEESSFFE